MRSNAWKIAFAWTPIFVLWALVARISADIGIAAAIRSGAVGIGTAAVLGQGVWWVTGRFPWPERLRLSFYATHAALALAYGVVWLWVAEIAAALAAGRLPGQELMSLWRWELAGWRVIMGIWLYGLVAGVSYTIRVRAKLQEQRDAAARLEALATRARLESLRARLNPHFLFNALNTVAALVPDDPRAAERAIERLGDLLRYSLAESDRPVPLEREWAFTRDYLEMERLRLGDRLRLTTDLDPAALQATVPPLSVQTLVENTVRHAAAPTEGGASIHVGAAVEGDTLKVVVRDDGPGRSPEDLDRSPGTGLRNLRERIRGAYGDSGSLAIDTAPGRGFAVVLTIPQHTRP